MGAPIRSPIPGVTRRDFLKYCAAIATTIGLGKSGTVDVAMALERLARRPSVVWSSFQVCTGCAVNLLQAREPDPAFLILRQISLDYQDNVMAAAGTAAEDVFVQVTEGDFYWVVEGSIPTKIPEATMIAGRTAADIARETYPKAAATIAMGSCATYGNIQAADPNPTGAMGIAEFLRQEGTENPVVINLPRCPGHGDDLLTTLSSVLVTGELPDLDPVGRPVFLYGQTIHDSCYRRGHFEAGEFVERFGDPRTLDDWCLYKVGCKGPVTYAPCGKNLWNGNVSWCVHNAPCQGCAEPDFWDNLTPFYEQVRGADVAGDKTLIPFETIGLVAGGVAAVGIGAHAIGQTVRARRGESPTDKPVEGGER